MPDSRGAVTAAEIIRNFGFWQQQALLKPVTITHHGRDRVMLLSIEEYDRLRSHNGPGEPSDEHRLAHLKCGAIVDNMAEIFIAYDANLKISEVNRVAEAYYGRSRSEMIGRTLHEALGQPRNTVIDEIIQRVLRTGESEVFETGSTIFPGRRVKVCCFPYAGGVGSLKLNITEQERLRSTEAEWTAGRKALAQLRQVSVVKLDMRGRVTHGDDVFVALTGFQPGELAEVRIFEIIDNADRRRMQNTFETVLAEGAPAVLTIRMMVKSGDTRAITLSMAPLTVDFSVQGVIAAMREG